MLKDKIKTIKVKEKALKYSRTLNTPVVKKTQAMPSNLNVINKRKIVKLLSKSYI